MSHILIGETFAVERVGEFSAVQYPLLIKTMLGKF
jgi:hypothetical protein